jgi:hypothetical protein
MKWGNFKVVSVKRNPRKIERERERERKGASAQTVE